ncbi:MAG: polysaccharide deacetylase family protein [Wenzhouxiangella sp.]|jgi:predicted deacetylase|nr:polysaccharide deacetylase family protein [Wenzhouxiangella sp.]
MRLLVSIHDVMPDTLTRTETIFALLNQAGLTPVTLLVVPGAAWRPEHIERLRQLIDEGAELAGHGWTHKAQRIRGPKHWLHSRIISRRAAEHLALTRFGIIRLMLRNHAWFAKHDLMPPKLYVPPAWAMGNISPPLLDRLPFQQYETLAGVYSVPEQRLVRLPIAGFETDTFCRALSVAGLNQLNRLWSQFSGKALRLGIHPYDFDLKLASSLHRWIRMGGDSMSYSDLCRL